MANALGSLDAANNLVIENKYISIPSTGRGANILNYIDFYSTPPVIYFRHCVINGHESIPTSSFLRRFNKIIVFDSCNINAYFEKAEGEISVSNTLINVMLFSGCQNSKIYVGNNDSIKFMGFLDCKNLSLTLESNTFTGPFNFRSLRNHFKEVNFFTAPKKIDNVTYSFFSDTIDYVILSHSLLDSLANYKFKQCTNTIKFQNCYIKADFISASRFYNSQIIFNTCQFGSESYLGDLLVDKVSFSNCNKIDFPLNIGFGEENKHSELRIVNTDVSNLRINWTDSVKLVFDSLDNEDLINNTYENLLSKYKAEGKNNSYRILEIQKLKREQNAFFYFLSDIWWNHGYDKNRVYYWTLFFLVIFCTLNYIWWQRMQAVYSLFEIDIAPYSRPTYVFRKILSSFLYSTFLFFAISIKLDKLSLKNARFLMFFLFQYFLGLFTLLFILKAVFKW